MLHVRRRRNPEKHKKKIVICTGSDQTAMESIVTAQQGLRSVHDMMKQTNITLLKLWSILISEAPRVYSITSILFHVWFCVFNLFFCVCVYAAYKHCDGGHELRCSGTGCDSVQIYTNGSRGVRWCVDVKNWEAEAK